MKSIYQAINEAKISGAAVKRVLADHPKKVSGWGTQGWEFHQRGTNSMTGLDTDKHRIVYRTSDNLYRKLDNDPGKDQAAHMASENSKKHINAISKSLTGAGISHKVTHVNAGDAKMHHHAIEID